MLFCTLCFCKKFHRKKKKETCCTSAEEVRRLPTWYQSNQFGWVLDSWTSVLHRAARSQSSTVISQFLRQCLSSVLCFACYLVCMQFRSYYICVVDTLWVSHMID